GHDLGGVRHTGRAEDRGVPVPKFLLRRTGPRGSAPSCACCTSLFNEGYTALGGPVLHRADLSGEAVRLARQVHRLLPDEGEVAGLPALMLLTEARRPARTPRTAS
ncbi:DUF6596 domain-containing protein, partial [Streptomyces sp. NPDC005070]